MLTQKQFTAEQLNRKTTLTEPAMIAALSRGDQAGALAIVNLFEPQRRTFKNMLRLFFTIAGFSWFFIFFPSLLELPEDKVATFRINQYQIYLILLTLWGFELKMQEKRLAFLLNLAAALGRPWYRLTRQDVTDAGNMHLFELFTKQTSDGKYLHVAFVWLLIVLVLVQFARQGAVLFG